MINRNVGYERLRLRLYQTVTTKKLSTVANKVIEFVIKSSKNGTAKWTKYPPDLLKIE